MYFDKLRVGFVTLKKMKGTQPIKISIVYPGPG